jgi:hypothetical protein
MFFNKKEWNHNYYLEHKEKNKEARKEYYKIYYPLHREEKNKASLRWAADHLEKTMLNGAKTRAKKGNLEFNITTEDIIIPEFCPLLGCKITHIQGRGCVQTNASLDKIDPTKGYIKGNVQVISRLANAMKQDATVEQLLSFAHNILRVYK